MHENTGEPNFNESMYFNFYDRDARARRLRAHRQPAERALRRDDDRRLPAGRHRAVQLQASGDRRQLAPSPPAACASTSSSRSSTCASSYDGHAVYLARPLDLEDPRACLHHQPAPAGVARARLLRPQPDVRRRGAGAEQRDGVRQGPLRAARARRRHAHDRRRRTTASSGFGLRDHSWGPRSWQSPKYYRWLTCEFDDGFGFMGSQIVTQNGSELLSGFVFRDGENHFVHNLELHTDWTDDGHYHDRIDADAAQRRRRLRDHRQGAHHAAAAQPPRRQGDAHQRRADRVALRRARRLRAGRSTSTRCS